MIGSAFDGNGTHVSTQWQIWGDESRIDAVYDSGEDTVNLVTTTVNSVTLDPGESCWNYSRYNESAAWNGGNDGDMIDYTAAGPDIALSNNFGWQKFQLDPAVVQGWQASDAASARGVLIANVPINTNQGVKVFLSSDNGDASLRPKLMLATEFIPEPTGGIITVILLGLACFRRRY